MHFNVTIQRNVSLFVLTDKSKGSPGTLAERTMETTQHYNRNGPVNVHMINLRGGPFNSQGTVL